MIKLQTQDTHLYQILPPPPLLWYIESLLMMYRIPYLCFFFKTPTHGISSLLMSYIVSHVQLLWNIDPLLIVYRPLPHPWYFDPIPMEHQAISCLNLLFKYNCCGILTPPMKYQTPSCLNLLVK
jgi:hypothetical protein